MSSDSKTADIVETLRAFGEMPLEVDASDPLIEVMNSVAHRAADEIERLRAKIDRLRAKIDRLRADIAMMIQKETEAVNE